MAEPNKAEYKQLATIFLEKYNQTNNTKYAWDDEKSIPKTQEYYDLMLFSEDKEPLLVQHTQAIENAERDIVRWKRVDPVIKSLHQLEKYNLPAFSTYVNFSTVPKNKQEQDKLSYWLKWIIERKITDSLGLHFFTWSKRFDNEFMPKIEDWVSELHIRPLENYPIGYMLVTFGTSKDYPEPRLDDAQVVLRAVDKKESDHAPTDVLLLVQVNSPVSDYYIEPMKQELLKRKYQEVWIVENLGTTQRSFRVK